MSDDLIAFLDDDEEPATATEGHAPPWRVLVVDDDEEVHSVTTFIFHSIDIFGRPVQLLHAHSTNEAKIHIQQNLDIAVILLDVVMETENAGLTLVSYIRDEMKLAECRIILRTGQPGYAPELTVFNDYDINDYRTKADLNHTRLITMVSAALRSYEQICTIAENRRGLELIVRSAADLMERHAIANFAEGALTQVAALLKLPLDGIVCVQQGSPITDNDYEHYYVVGAAGRYAQFIAQPLEELHESRIINAIAKTMARREHVFDDDYTVLYLQAGQHLDAAVFIDTDHPLASLDRQLIEVFASNIAACFSNVKLVERLNFVAYHDILTGLPNRLSFIRTLDKIAKDQTNTVIALLDINHFSDLNDGLGLDIGNALLVAIADKLRAMLEPECQLAHLGADVFGIIGPESKVNPNDLPALFHEPLDVGEYWLPITITMGLCHNLDNVDSGVALLKRANIALNRAKKSLHSHYEYYQAEMEDNTRWRVEIIRQLRQDFQAGQLEVWYQPQISLEAGDVIGLEALLRWPSDNGFVQPPSVFIPLAEYSGLIIQIGAWVLGQACAQQVRLMEQGFSHIKMAVNVSMPQFRKPGLVTDVSRILEHYQLPPHSLELEITESIAMDEPKVVLQTLGALKQLGIAIAVDDFGTGYSSLGQLRSLPIDCIKIDRMFIQEIKEGKGGMFAETIVALSDKLGVTSLAEGVETPEQASFLRGLGCTAAQGYLYARPMPANSLMKWLQQRPQSVPVE